MKPDEVDGLDVPARREDSDVSLYPEWENWDMSLDVLEKGEKPLLSRAAFEEK